MSASKPRITSCRLRTATQGDGGLAARADGRRKALRTVLEGEILSVITKRMVRRAYKDRARNVVCKLVRGRQEETRPQASGTRRQRRRARR